MPASSSSRNSTRSRWDCLGNASARVESSACCSFAQLTKVPMAPGAQHLARSRSVIASQQLDSLDPEQMRQAPLAAYSILIFACLITGAQRSTSSA